MVSAMLSPVSPSATGKTLRSLISWRRSSRWASATAVTWRNRRIDGSGTERDYSRGAPFASPLRPAPDRPSGGLGHLVRLQAAAADVDAPRGAVVVDSNLLEVRVEAPPGGDHRVRSRVPERGLLTAVPADLGHGTEDGSGAAPSDSRLKLRHPQQGQGGVSTLVALVPPGSRERLLHGVAGEHA